MFGLSQLIFSSFVTSNSLLEYKAEKFPSAKGLELAKFLRLLSLWSFLEVIFLTPFTFLSSQLPSSLKKIGLWSLFIVECKPGLIVLELLISFITFSLLSRNLGSYCIFKSGFSLIFKISSCLYFLGVYEIYCQKVFMKNCWGVSL